MAIISGKLIIRQTPASLAARNVALDNIPTYVAYGAKKFSSTPKPGHVFGQVREVSSQNTRRNSLKKLQSLANRHTRRTLNKQMDMIRQDLQLVNHKTIPNSHKAQSAFTNLPEVKVFEQRPRLVRLPNQMVSILTNRMLKTSQIQLHFRCLHATKNIAHANRNTNNACANFVAHAFIINNERKNYRRKDGSSLMLKHEVSAVT